MHNVFIFSYQEDADASLSSMQSIVTSVQESLTHGNKMIQRSINFCADQAFKVGVDRGFIYKTCLDSYHVIFYALSKTDGGSSGGNASMPSLDVGGSSGTPVMEVFDGAAAGDEGYAIGVATAGPSPDAATTGPDNASMTMD